MMNKQQQILELVNFCNEFATQHSVNGNTVIVEYTPNSSIVFTVIDKNRELQKIFGHPSEKASIWYINLNFCGIMQSVQDAVMYIKEYVYTGIENDEHKETMYWMQENVSIPTIEAVQRREFLQRGLPEKLSLTTWYEEQLKA